MTSVEIIVTGWMTGFPSGLLCIGAFSHGNVSVGATSEISQYMNKVFDRTANIRTVGKTHYLVEATKNV